MDVTLLRPDLVAEVSGDTAVDRGSIWRHPVRYACLRADVTAEDGRVSDFV
ncbi:ATP-dependent DNA ligase [Streptomyces sp. NBC_00162]|uniref:ATP-dependent DNA ligase n=1 Tax=Streptomyces sp. NBC_00162 TaxID=2903629 RepID=UPI00214C1254|nr:ATP-dependent DNA ligase [Streptomyces sp. NBC_00162]UUU44337.1 ATP-dependent DNA ligase [Streptomyces sp. NBC_00162]